MVGASADSQSSLSSESEGVVGDDARCRFLPLSAAEDALRRCDLLWRDLFFLPTVLRGVVAARVRVRLRVAGLLRSFLRSLPFSGTLYTLLPFTTSTTMVLLARL